MRSMKAEHYDLALRGRVLTPGGERHGTVLVAAGHIMGIVGLDVPGTVARLIDAGQGWIAPGFIDLQLNGGLGYDFGTAPDGVAVVARWLPRTGVTAFLPTLITAPIAHLLRTLVSLQSLLARPHEGARPLGVHLEGPYLSPAYHGAHAADWLRPVDLPELARLCDAGPVRLMTLAPEQEGGLAAISWLRERGVLVSAGHSGATYAQAREALTAGVTLGTHLFNAMAPLHHRAPGLPGALLTEPGVRVSLIADGVHVHPAMLALAYRLRGAPGLALITDGMAALGMADGEYQLAGRAVQVRSGEARLADGTLAGGVLSMDAALRTMVTATGCSISEAVRMASETPAAVLGLTDRGRIEAGAIADMVVLDANLRVCLTVIGGRIAWETSGAAA